jgi:hypothetical protein
VRLGQTVDESFETREILGIEDQAELDVVTT